MQKHVVHILCDRNSPRLQFVLDLVFSIHLSLKYKVVTDEKSIPIGSILINYNTSIPEQKSISISRHALLFEETIYSQHVIVDRSNEGKPFFFGSYDFKGDYIFDVFALIFYHITRYEEYLRFIPDAHGRFSASQSLAFRNKFLMNPIVDVWILDLKKKIEKKWAIEIPLKRSFEICPTFDIDTPYAFLAKPFFLHLAAIIRDIGLLRLTRLRERLYTLFGARRDPFDTYDQIALLLDQYDNKAVFFFLMRLHFLDDLNFSVRSKKFKELIEELAAKNEIGIHPSLFAYSSNIELKKEFDHLKKLSNRVIDKSRQHFLRLEFPKTYRNLLDMGIQKDYSMGYHDRSGFRAGTCVPFPWFDLRKNERTNLMIYPMQTMDATLRHHLKYSTEEAIREIEEIKARIKEVRGEFRFIWHNSSFAEIYGWKDWENVLKACIVNSHY